MTTLSGCPAPGFGPHASFEPVIPRVGAPFTVRLEGPLYGPTAVHDGDVFEVFIDTAERPLTFPSDPQERVPRDGGVKLGDITLRAGAGQLELVLQPEYGPDKYGRMVRLEPGNAVELRVHGNMFTQTTELPVLPRQ